MIINGCSRGNQHEANLISVFNMLCAKLKGNSSGGRTMHTILSKKVFAVCFSAVVALMLTISVPARAVEVTINGQPYTLDQGGLGVAADGSITINMSASNVSGLIQGTVSNAPFAELFLKASGIDDGVAKHTRINKYGKFEFRNLPPTSTYELIPLLNGYSFIPTSLDVTLDATGAMSNIINPDGTSVTVTPTAINFVGTKGTVASAPTAPTNLSCNSSITSSTIGLQWSDNSTDETGFNIYQSATSTRPANPTYTPGSNNSASAGYTVSNLAPSSSYYFWVQAYNGTGPSSIVGPCVNTTSAAGTGGSIPQAPSNLTCSSSVTGSTIGLQWTDNSSDETGFNIYQSATSTRPANPTYTPSLNSTSLTVGSLSASSTYYFWIQALNGTGPSSIVGPCVNTTLAGSGGGTGSGLTPTDPIIITPTVTKDQQAIGVNEVRYYAVTVDTSKASVKFGISLYNQTTDVNMLVMDTNAGMIDRYSYVFNYYTTNKAWGGGVVFTNPGTWAAFSHVLTGEFTTVRSPYSSSTLYVMVKNEGPTSTVYKISVNYGI